jgi:hypothetical protein
MGTAAAADPFVTKMFDKLAYERDQPDVRLGAHSRWQSDILAELVQVITPFP